MTTDVIKQIRRATRRRFTAEEKIRIVLEGLRGEIPVTELCRQEGIQPSIYYKWSKAFLDSGKNGLTRETSRDATSGEVRRLKEENEALKKAVAEMVLENQKLKVWACKAKEVSEDAQRAQAGSFKGGRGLRVAGPGGTGSTGDSPVDLLSVERRLSKEGVSGTPGPPPGIETGLESDPASRTGPDPADSLVVSRVVPTGGELPGNGWLWVYGFRILGLPDPEDGRTDPGSSSPELPCRKRVSDQDHQNQPAVANGCDLSSGQELGLVLSHLGPG